MQHLSLFRAALERPVVAPPAGVGEFGISLIAQSRRMKGLNVRAVLDRDVGRVATALKSMNLVARICGSGRDAKTAWDAGAIAVCGNIDDLLALPVEILVEATGDAEAGARHAAAAIAAGIAVAMVTKEAECVGGPALD